MYKYNMEYILSWIIGILAILGVFVWIFTTLLPSGSKHVIKGGGYLIDKYMKSKKRK